MTCIKRALLPAIPAAFYKSKPNFILPFSVAQSLMKAVGTGNTLSP